MKTVNIQHEADIKAQGNHTSKNCKPVICLETGEVYTSMIDAADALGVHFSAVSAHLRGKSRTVKGKHFCEASRINESLNSVLTRFREVSALEEDARKWREYHAAQEEIRIAKEKHDAEIVKARAKVEKLREKRDELYIKYTEALGSLNNAEVELEALENMEG